MAEDVSIIYIYHCVFALQFYITYNGSLELGFLSQKWQIRILSLYLHMKE